MARLARLRLVNLGHSLAHMDDLLLDFTDVDGSPSDSAVWLRNGGGKSSILNLFYAMLQPHRAKFLGATAEQKGRRLEDYVGRQAPGAVLAEWALDTSSPQLFGGAHDRLITGVFYETRDDARGEEGRVQRLFFAYSVLSDVPTTSLEAVPLFGETPETGAPVRRTLAAFEAELKGLRRQWPHAEVLLTDKPSEWTRMLDDLGLDPELFAYQIRMNAQEGGADRLFAFGEERDFVNFFLEVMLDPEPSEQVARNVEQWRTDLRRRTDALLPERALVAGLLERLAPLGEVAAERRTLSARLAEAWGALAGAARAAAGAVQDALGRAESEDRSADGYERDAAEAAKQLADAERLAAAYERFVAEHEHIRAAEAEAEARRRADEAGRAYKTWEAAVPLYRMRAAEAEARTHREALERKRQDLKPLLTQVEAAAAAYAAALRARGTRAAEEAGRLRAVAAVARQAARAAHERRTEASKEIGAHGRDVELHERGARAAQRDLEQLVRVHALHAGEAPITALNRLRREREESRAELEAAQEAERATASRRETVRRLLAEARTERQLAARDLRQQNAELADATAQAAALSASPFLARLLSVESPGPEDVVPGLSARLRGAARDQLDASIRLRLDRAVDDRAIAALEATRLLPPRRDVERVRDLLRQVVLGAWSGWEYLFTATPLGGVRAFVERAPAVADGVVVRDADFEAACAHLRALEGRGALTLDGPVLVAPQSLLTSGGGTAFEVSPARVFGPSDDAAFNAQAGDAALDARRLSGDRIRDALARHDEEQAGYSTLADKVDAHLDRYPAGWMERQRSTVSALERRGAEAAERAAGLEAEEGDLGQTILNEQALVVATRLRFEDAGAAHIRVEAYLRQHPEGPDGYRRLAADARAAADAARERDRAAARDAGVEETRERDSLRDAERQDAQAREDRGRADAVRYRPAAASAQAVDAMESPPAADAALLQATYESFVADYEGRLDARAAQSLMERAEREAADARRRFRDALKDPSVSEADAEQALASLPDPSEVEDRRQRAAEAAHQANSAIGRPSQVAALAARALREAVQRAEAVGAPWPLPVEVASPEEARRLADSATLDARHFEQEHTDARELIAVCRTAAAEYRSLAKDVGHAGELIASALETHATLRQALAPDEIAEQSFPKGEVTADGLRAAADAARAALGAIASGVARLDDSRRRCVDGVRAWLGDPEFEALRSLLLTNLRQWDPPQYEQSLATLTEDLRVRLHTIIDDITAIDANRSLLIDSAYSAANEGLRRLKQLEPQSKIPPTVAGIGGHAFLKVRTFEPESADEKKARLGELIDDIVRKGAVPKGLPFTQQAVARLAGDVRVQVVFPDPDDRVHYVPIVDLAKFSGGERLTCATLLYCTLARLRARIRGRAEQSSGVLLYDNPIGKASRPKFLQLQRAVARQMGVQLIYFTGVDDLEAIRVLPNRIRLRNARRDRRSGRRLLEEEVDEKSMAASTAAEAIPLGTLDSARIVEAEPAGVVAGPGRETSP